MFGTEQAPSQGVLNVGECRRAYFLNFGSGQGALAAEKYTALLK
jgi:hypothetical protein